MSQPTRTPPKPKPTPEEIGFTLNDKGQVTGFNPNAFCRHITTKLTLIFSPQQIFYQYKNGVFLMKTETELKARLYRLMNRVLPDSWRVSYETQYIRALQNEVYSAKGMNPYKHILNLENAMLDIDTLQTLNHDPAFASTIRLPFAYDSKAKCPRFQQFLHEVFEGDPQRIAIAEEILGYCLTLETKAHKAFLLYGGGSNGKSIFCEVLRQLCGEANVSGVSLNELGNSFARLDLVDKTVNLVTETESNGAGFNTEFFKTLVSGDALRVEVKHGASFTIKPTVKLVAAMNSLPRTNDQTFGLSRRLLILPFQRQFETRKNSNSAETNENIADVDLLEKLLSELPGIFNLALKGLKRLRANDFRFTQSEKVDAELRDFTETINPLGTFVDEMIVKAGTESRIRNKTLCRVFAEWCVDRGHKKTAEISDIRFHTLLKSALRNKRIPFGTEKSGGERYLTGIDLSRAATETMEQIPECRPSKVKKTLSAANELEDLL